MDQKSRACHTGLREGHFLDGARNLGHHRQSPLPLVRGSLLLVVEAWAWKHATNPASQACTHNKFPTPQCDAIHGPGPVMSGHKGVHPRLHRLLSQLQPWRPSSKTHGHAAAKRQLESLGAELTCGEATVRTIASQRTAAESFHTLCAKRPPSSQHPDLVEVCRVSADRC